MQSKVSIVIPCYNKEKFIGGMFDSILAQEWDNIELILVNDGSTDNTRNIIAEYESKFVTRGYEVVIIDQENQGVSAAVRNGLLQVTGEYVCQIDADDSLDPQYASMMAKWLDENPDYDWVACDANVVAEESEYGFHTFPNGITVDFTLDKWILERVNNSCWVYMIRVVYMRDCKVDENFYVGRDGNQEAQFFLPLFIGGGNIGYIHEALYIYNKREPITHRSHRENYEKAKARWHGFDNAFGKIINSLPIDDIEKTRLSAISELWHGAKLLYDSNEKSVNSQNRTEAGRNFCELVKRYFTPSTCVNWDVVHENCLLLCTAVIDNIMGTKVVKLKIPNGRIIAWGALGRNASFLLPLLVGSELEPDELWDLAGDGQFVTKPEVEKLRSDDLVLIMPVLNGGIVSAMSKSGCQNKLFQEDILSYLAVIKFPYFYDNTIHFTMQR